MERLTTDEIIQLGLMNRATLIYKVRNELMVAYDDKDKPVDLKKKEQMFLDIQRLCEPKIEIEKVKKREIDSGCFTGGTWDPRKARYDRVYYVDENKKYRRINVIQDQYPTQAGMVTNAWIDWDILHSTLSDRDIKDPPINIAFSQEQAIMKGWNSDRIFDFIKEATFNEDDLPKIPNKKQTKPGKSDQRATQTDLLIIGGLLGLIKDKTELLNNEKVIEALQNWIPNVPGWSQRTLQDRFAIAKRAIDSLD